MSKSATWDNLDFAGPRFFIVSVSPTPVCCDTGCERLGEYLVGYSMQRDGWSYDYRAAYCDEHLPPQARDLTDPPAEARTPTRLRWDEPAQPLDPGPFG